MSFTNIYAWLSMCSLGLAQVTPGQCYAECLQSRTEPGVTVNVAMIDNRNTWSSAEYVWLANKTVEFNTLFPSITVTLVPIARESIQQETLQDVVNGSNFLHAYLMNMDSSVAEMSGYLLDMSKYIVDNVNEIAWQRIARFFKSHSALYQGKVLVLPLAGDFMSLMYRLDYFSEHNRTVPRTLEEYAQLAQYFDGKDLNGDGVPDYGSCLLRTGQESRTTVWSFVAAYTQYLGTSQGAFFDTETLEPLIDNPAVHEALRIWKEVGGPTIENPVELLSMWSQGRCAMTLTLAQTSYSTYQSRYTDMVTGFALTPGSRRVWWREGNKVVDCNVSFCPKARVYPDGAVVNHAPYSFSLIGGSVNGQVDEETQLAAFIFLSWLMNDANKIEAVISPSSQVGLSIVRPSLLVPSLWKAHGWQDPAVSLFNAISTANAEHPNAVLTLRLPRSMAYLGALTDTVASYWLGTGVYRNITVEEGAVSAAAAAQVRMQAITDAGALDVAIENYQKMLGIYVNPTDQVPARATQEIPNWAVLTSGILVGILCLLLASVCVGWLAMTHLQRRRLRAKDETRMMCIIEEAKSAVDELHFPMAVVGAADFLELECLVDYECLRESGKLTFLDSVAKIEKFKEERCIVVFSHQWLGRGSPDPSGTHFWTICSVVRMVAKMMSDRGDAKVRGISNVFIWVDVCSVPQSHRATQELAVTSLPLYVTACDMFVVVAPPAVHSVSNGVCNLETYLSRGWCRAEILAKVTGTGFGNLFVCESMAGDLQHVTEEALRRMDLRVFDGDFSCCFAKHEGSKICDRELLRTPILGVYLNFMKTQKFLLGDKGEEDVTCARSLHFAADNMFPKHIDFEKRVPGTTEVIIERRALFGELLVFRALRDTLASRPPSRHHQVPPEEYVAVPVQSQTCVKVSKDIYLRGVPEPPDVSCSPASSSTGQEWEDFEFEDAPKELPSGDTVLVPEDSDAACSCWWPHDLVSDGSR